MGKEIFDRPRNIAAAAAISLNLLALPHHEAVYAKRIQYPNVETTVNQNSFRDIAMATYHTMEANFTASPEGLMRERSDRPSYAFIWTQSRVIDALSTMVKLPDIGKSYQPSYQQSLDVTKKYWDNKPGLPYLPGLDPEVYSPNRTSIERYTDDNLWIGLSLMREWTLTKDQQYLDRAIEIFNMAIGAWNETEGGIMWKEQLPGEIRKQRVTVSNAAAIQLGAMLYTATRDVEYLNWSKKILDWEDNTLLDKQTFLYNDNIGPADPPPTPSGTPTPMRAEASPTPTITPSALPDTINKVKLTYDDGAMIGALAQLAVADPKEFTMKPAIQLSINALNNFRNGGYVYEIEKPEYASLLFPKLLYVADQTGNSQLVNRVEQTLQHYILSQLTPRLDKTHLVKYAPYLHLNALASLPQSAYKSLL